MTQNEPVDVTFERAFRQRVVENGQRLKECEGVAGFHIMAIEWKEKLAAMKKVADSYGSEQKGKILPLIGQLEQEGEGFRPLPCGLLIFGFD